MLRFNSSTAVPLILQDEASECGLACLAMVATAHGHEIDLHALRQRFAVSLRGMALDQITRAAEQLGFNCRPMRVELAELAEIELPAILHWNLNHFVVLTKVERRAGRLRYHVNDPAKGAVVVESAEVSTRFTGIALELFRSEAFKKRTKPPSLQLKQLWSSARGLWANLGSVLALSVVLQLAVLASPFYLQLAVDNALPTSDQNLLAVLALGFLGLAGLSFCTTWLRSSLLIYIANSLAYQLAVNLFRHQFRLPLGWFERRHVGDIASRFGSARALSDMLSHGFIAAVLDAVMAISTCIFMFIYSPALAGVALGALAVYGMLRAAFLVSLRNLNVNVIAAEARENSLFLESVRGVAAIKAFGYEHVRQRHWQRAKADSVNAQIKLQRLTARFDAANQFVLAMERVAFVYIAVVMAMKGSVSLGMIFAFQAYKQSFLDAACRLIEQGANVAVLRLHLARVADIALATPESADGAALPASTAERQSPPSIELRGVCFSYGAGEPNVLSNINLRVEAGESVVLAGPSGCGKTTLLKVMMGLLSPTAGEVLINGQPMRNLGLRRWRELSASVAQDDALFAGSIAENIAFFSPDIDMDRIHRVAGLVGLAEEIARMPMGYNTLVGDMGSVLSGGQKQRVLMARALYKAPSALFVDEGTAHLDVASEHLLLQALAALPATRVSVAHRPAAVAGRGRIILLRQGAIREVTLPRVADAMPVLQGVDA